MDLHFFRFVLIVFSDVRQHSYRRLMGECYIERIDCQLRGDLMDCHYSQIEPPFQHVAYVRRCRVSLPTESNSITFLLLNNLT